MASSPTLTDSVTSLRFADFGSPEYHYFVSKGFTVIRRADDRRCKLAIGDRVILQGSPLGERSEPSQEN